MELLPDDRTVRDGSHLEYPPCVRNEDGVRTCRLQIMAFTGTDSCTVGQEPTGSTGGELATHCQSVGSREDLARAVSMVFMEKRSLNPSVEITSTLP